MAKIHKVFSLLTIFDFGKHNEHSLAHVIRQDRKYIRWIIGKQPDGITDETVNYIIAIDDSAMDYMEKIHPNYLNEETKMFNAYNLNRMTNGSNPIRIAEFLKREEIKKLL